MPKQLLVSLVALNVLLSAGLLQAAPKQVDMQYQVTRKGQPFASISETYREASGRYRIESVTSGIGVYALFGKRRLVSEGEVTAGGLKPGHFELQQGDNSGKAQIADFDWPGNTLNMNVKGTLSTTPIEKGAQDLISYAYQFMFSGASLNKPATGDFSIAVATGKKLGNYHYLVVERNLPLTVPAGQYKTIHLRYDTTDLNDQKELWLAPESHYLPVRILMHDESGTEIEQTLTSMHASE